MVWFRASDRGFDFTRSPSFPFLQGLLSRYRVDNLVDVSPSEFRRHIDEFLSMEDATMEGYSDPLKQRDLSIKFRWGHNHDFGAFRLAGEMRDRHLWLLSTFMDQFGTLPRDLNGKTVLDIGCWTGGTSLLLAAMGAHEAQHVTAPAEGLPGRPGPAFELRWREARRGV